MESIPTSLVKSLNDLGLSNNEANVYAALVLYDNAEAKDLTSFSPSPSPVYTRRWITWRKWDWP